MQYLENYLQKVPEKKRSKAAIAYMAAIDHVHEAQPDVANRIIQELKDQRRYLKMIASENYSSLAVQLAMGNLLTDKYSEGYPHHRFYAGCENVDAVEDLAIHELKSIFGCEHAYVQPHSGADANMVATWAFLIQKVQNKELERLGKKTIDALTPDEYEKVRQLLVNQKVMGMSLNSGGHLTHGYRHNISAKIMKSVPYDVDPHTHLLDYSALKAQVQKEKPSLFIVGYSAYPRLINFAIMREIADSVGATMLVDMAHFAGLVAGKVMKGEFDPIPFAHLVTSTTHKTLRGPRGGLVMCQNEFKEAVNKGCPLVLGGPLPHVMAAKAVAFKEANTTDFQKYAHQIVANCKALAQHLLVLGADLVTKGTDNHLLVMDVAKTFGLTGRQAEFALREAGITVNRNTVPFDPNGPWYASGVRLGTAALTTLGMKPEQMKEIALIIFELLKSCHSVPPEPHEKNRSKVIIEPQLLERTKKRCHDLLKQFPLYPELLID